MQNGRQQAILKVVATGWAWDDADPQRGRREQHRGGVTDQAANLMIKSKHKAINSPASAPLDPLFQGLGLAPAPLTH